MEYEYSDLEMMVRFDMFEMGYDADDKYDIEAYWESRLS